MPAIGRIDVHAHLLPGIDDGCADVAESLAAARALVDVGYTHLFCTPHIWPSLPGNAIDSIRAAVLQLQTELDRARIPLKLMGGGELNLLTLWPQLQTIPDRDIVTYGLGSRYVLFDFWVESYADCQAPLESAIAHLRSRGYQPVLAHPERIGALQNEPDKINRLIDLGVLLQLNSWCLVDPPATPTNQIAMKLLRENKYFLIGTDLHKPSGMQIRLRGIEMAEQLAGKDAVDRLSKENPRLLFPTAETEKPGQL
jgi:protein-tyrosine phosphatase